ncbi:MAG: GTP 3',8-cyclase MoaA [Thermoplasmatota archaeon]
MTSAPFPTVRPALADAFGRGVTDIRVSLTNRCNFHCVYCHNEGLGDTLGPRDPSPGEMTTGEVVRLLRIAREFGIVNVKFTGGEPMLRRDLEDIVRAVAPTMRASLTTNGSMLARRASGLAAAGLERVNVSIDSLDPHHFQDVRRGALAPVLEGLDAALDAGLAPIKVNQVVLDETLGEIDTMIEWVSSRPGLELQLIEVMPELRTDMREHRVDVPKLREWLAARATRVEERTMHHRKVYHFGSTKVELVDPVGNADFCANCHRIRVTHDGMLKGCLNRTDDLIPTRGLDDDDVRDAFRRCVANRVPYYGVHVPIPVRAK